MFEIFIALIPVVGGILNSLITPILGGRKDESDIIDKLALQLEKEKLFHLYLKAIFQCCFAAVQFHQEYLKNCFTWKIHLKSFNSSLPAESY